MNYFLNGAIVRTGGSQLCIGGAASAKYSDINDMENKWGISSALFGCPLCGKQMKASKSSIFCEKGHCYDISKKGYINFVQRKPIMFYSAELFKNRSLLYSNGFYDKIIETMNLLVVRDICNCDKCIVDVGCGEGTFLIRLCILSDVLWKVFIRPFMLVNQSIVLITYMNL